MTVADPESVQARARAALEHVAERALETNRARVREIEDVLMAAAEGGTIDDAAREHAARLAHRIAGSAGTFGLDRASGHARALELYLAATSFADPATLLPAMAALEALTVELDAGYASSPEPAPASPARHDLLVAHESPELAARIIAAARARDWDGRWAPDSDTALAMLAERAPAVALLDFDLAPAGGRAFLAAARATEPPTPTIVLFDDDSLIDRVEASRAGASGFLDVHVPPDRVFSTVVEAFAAHQGQRARLLALDDDVVILDVLRALFRGTGIEVSTVSDAQLFWSSLESTQPDLVLLDVDMPDVSGLELCRALRSDRRWATIPILVLTGSVAPAKVVGVFHAGADDYVSKPVVGTELEARITNRLERERMRRQLAESDHLTGLFNRAAFERAFGRMSRRAAAAGEPVSLALLDLEGFRALNEEHGHAVGDAVLQRLGTILDKAFAGDDVVGRWGDHEFTVAMLGLRREEGVARVSTLIDAWRSESFGEGGRLRPRLSAAVSEQGVDGADMREHYRALVPTIREVERAGAFRVVPVGWRPRKEEGVVDVVIVEDDPAVANLLLHTLEVRGLTGVHLADGALAVDRLTGAAALRTQVVLLDVDLPGLNGLDVLDRLRADGVLERTRVIMLTARSSESEVLAALRLGASDHVAKPFSLPVLMQRVRRAVRR